MTNNLEQDQPNLVDVIKQMSESNNNQAAASFLTIDLPKFHGKPNEDIDSFLIDYNIKTSTLSNSLKCSMIQRALVGDALLWFLHNDKLKSEDSWMTITTALRDRFASGDRKQRRLEKLQTMKFNPQEKTLTSYVESFVSLYKSVYLGAETKSILEHLDLNLPKNVRFALNLTDQDWLSRDLDGFYELVRKVETKVLPLQDTSEGDRDLAKKSDVEAILKQLTSLADKMSKPEEPKAKETATVAAAQVAPKPNSHNRNYPRRNPGYRNNDHNYGNGHYYNNNNRRERGNYHRNQDRGRGRFLPYNRDNRHVNHYYNCPPMLPANQRIPPAIGPPPPNELTKEQVPPRNTRTRPCRHCNAEHWDWECLNAGLKGRRSSN